MRYIWEARKPRRVMHIEVTNCIGEGTMRAMCGIPHQFNRSINAPWGLGRRICANCCRKVKESR